MMKAEVIARILATGQNDGAKAFTVNTTVGPVTGGDPTLIAAMAVERTLNIEAKHIPGDVDLSAEHFGELSAALLLSIDKAHPIDRSTLARSGIDNMMQHRLKGLELKHAAEAPGLAERIVAAVAKVRELLRL